MHDNNVIALAGASGDLGGRILAALIQRGAVVRALLRHAASQETIARLSAMGAEVICVDETSADSMAGALEGAACIVSALNGLRDVIIDRQSVLLAAAIKAHVPRFISSDYSADFTKTAAGGNRNFDLRREFMALANRAPIKVTSILNGAFLDMLGAEMPIIQPRIGRVLYWGNADQVLDFTTKDNVAAYTAAAALDQSTPRFLRIAGNSVSARNIAQTMRDVTGKHFGILSAGSVGVLDMLIRIAKFVAPQPGATFPPWQGMQYMRDMFSGQASLEPLDNQRYPNIRWTSVAEHLASLHGEHAKSSIL